MTFLGIAVWYEGRQTKNDEASSNDGHGPYSARDYYI
jgi:hypothetical protein